MRARTSDYPKKPSGPVPGLKSKILINETKDTIRTDD